MGVHPNSLKNLKGGRKKGSKNKTTLAKKDIEKLLAKDYLVEVLIASKEKKVVGKAKTKKPNEEALPTTNNTLSTNNEQVVDNSTIEVRKVTLKEFFGFWD